MALPLGSLNKRFPNGSLSGRLASLSKLRLLDTAKEVRAWLVLGLLLLLLALVGIAGVKLVSAQMAEDIYRERLADLSADYAELRDQYERALRESVVTELVVSNGELTVAYRRADGELVETPTTLNPSKEIFVDFYVAGNRIGIRRLFDGSISAESALVLDEPWNAMAADAPPSSFGRTVYRKLGEGRWVVTMTGNGSLGLEPAADGGRAVLAPLPPQIRPELPVRESDEAVGEISFGDTIGWVKARLWGSESSTD